MTSINTEELSSISEKFRGLHASLENAERQIARDLEDVSRKERLVKLRRNILEVENTKTFAENNLTDNEFMSGIVEDCDSKLAVLTEEKLEMERIRHTKILWSELGFDGLRTEIESIKTVLIPDKKPPELFLPSCSGGYKDIHFVWPNHVALDEKSGYIYVSDIQYSKIQIFNKDALFLKSFPHAFHKPRAMLIRKGRLYVIECLLDGNHVKFLIFSVDDEKLLAISDGVIGTGKGQFGITSSLDIDTDDKLYITEPDNKRIQLLNPDFQHRCFFASSTTFSHPIQIRIRDNFALVLDITTTTEEVVPHYCKLFVLRLDGTWIKNIILPRVNYAMYFAISICNHILVSDYSYGALKVFDFDGNLCNIGKRITHPKGIEVFNDGRVVSVSMLTPCIHIF